MKAIVFRAGQQVALETLPTPEPRAGEVLLQVRASGICHTDIEILRGNYGASAFPLVPGHEFAGEVVALGPDVTGFQVGDRVVVDPNIGCGTCAACARGRTNLCENLGAYGVTRNGGFAEYCTVTASRLVPTGDLDWQVAALAEPLGCVMNGLSVLAGRRCETALIFGGGPIGLLMALALQWQGAQAVTVVDLSEARLQLAQSFGLRAMAAGAEGLQNLRHSQDFVVDATGVPAVAEGLPTYIRDGGAGLFFGVCPQDARISIAPFQMFRRQLSLFGTHSLNTDIHRALPLLAQHQTTAARLVSHRLDLPEVLSTFQNGAPQGALKVQLAL